jgi:hypothetical protein
VFYNESGVSFNHVPNRTLKNSLSIFPNPATNVINIETLKSETNNKMQVFNIQGTLLFEKVFYGSTFQTDLSNLSNGVYFVQIISENLNQTIKVIKN